MFRSEPDKRDGERAAAPAEPSAAARSLRILQTVAASSQPVSLADLVEMTSMPKTTLHRACNQLVEQGFLARSTDARFTAGRALRALAFDTLSRGFARGLQQRVLSELVADVGETCNFTTLDGIEVVYLARVEAQWPLRLTLEAGSRVPVHCTASGKLLLASLPDTESRALLPRLPLDRLTPNTIGTRAALERALAEIRRLEYSTDREEFMAGLIAIAVPVRDAEKRVRAAIAMHAPTARMSLEQALKKLPRLREAAAAMARML